MELSVPPPFLELPIHQVVDCSALWAEYPAGSENFGLAMDLPATAKLETMTRWEAMKILESNGIHMTSPLRELLAFQNSNLGETPAREVSEKIMEEIGAKFRELGLTGSADLRELLAFHNSDLGETSAREASEKIIAEIGEHLRELNPAGSSNEFDLTARSLSLFHLVRSLEKKEEIDSLEKYRHHLDTLYAMTSVPPTTMREKMSIIRGEIGDWHVSYRGQWREHPLGQLQFELHILEYQYLVDKNLLEGEDAKHHYC